jgi:hypothetical protein
VLSTVRAHPLWRTRNFAGFSCFPSHSGHRAVVHHSCSETCGVCLTQRPFCPQTARRNRRATWPRLKWPGLPFFGTAKRETGVLIGTQSTHYPRHCRRIMIWPSLGYGSPACMTESEARAKFPKATHLYMREHCWSDSAVASVHSNRPPPRAAVPAPSARPATRGSPRAFPRIQNG